MKNIADPSPTKSKPRAAAASAAHRTLIHGALPCALGTALLLTVTWAIIRLPISQRLLLTVSPGPGFSLQERMTATEQLLNYFATGDRMQLVGYTPDEQAHVAEVAGFMRWLRRLLVVTIITALATGYLIAQSDGWRELRTRVRRTCGITAVMSLVLMASGGLGFDVLFQNFHALVFRAAPWTFDPAVSRLVNLYPPEYFRAALVVILGATATVGAGLWSFLRRPW